MTFLIVSDNQKILKYFFARIITV